MKMRNNLVKLTLSAVFTALSIVLVMYIRFPIFPALDFLEYDPADITIFLMTILTGPLYGLLMTVAVSIIQGITVSIKSGVVGITMHILATGTFVIVQGLVMRKSRTNKRVLLALILGAVSMVVTMGLWNLLFTPYFMNTTIEEVLKMMPFILAFNAIKAVLNGAIAFIIFKSTYKGFKKICKI